MPLQAKRAESLKLHCGKVNNTSWCFAGEQYNAGIVPWYEIKAVAKTDFYILTKSCN